MWNVSNCVLLARHAWNRDSSYIANYVIMFMVFTGAGQATKMRQGREINMKGADKQQEFNKKQWHD